MKRRLWATISFFLSLIILVLSCRTEPANSPQTLIQEESPKSEWDTLDGYIAKRVENRGSLSESSYYVLSKEPLSRKGGLILYRADTGKSRGFEEYLEMYVTISGKYGSGVADWKGTTRPGFLVENISISK